MATTVAQHSVATFTSPVNGTTPIDANTVRGNDNTVRSSYNDHDADPGIHVQSSTLASRPVAGTAGRKWITDDSGVYTLWFDDGTHWHPVSSENIALTVLAGENLVKGDVVKVTGWNNGQDLPEVVKTTSAADTAFAVITATVTSGSLGYATNTGIVQDVNTAAYSVGTILYANGSGGFTSTKPTSGNYQPVAYVLRANASNGVYYVEFSTPRIVERSDNTASTVVLRDSNGDFSAGTITATAVNATTLDLTNLEVTNIKAKDGTQAIAIADSTGATTFSANVAATLSTASQPNITSVGTLSSLTVSGDLTVDTSTLKVDSANNRVGIGTASPSNTLHVAGTSLVDVGTYSTGYALTLAASSETARKYQIGLVAGGNLAIYDTAAAATRLTVDTSGNLAVDTNTLYVDAANNRVGVGTASPTATFQLGGGSGLPQQFISGAGYDLYIGASGGTMFGVASGAISLVFNTASVPVGIGTSSAQPLIFGTNGFERARIDASGNLGLGVTPSAWKSDWNALDIETGVIAIAASLAVGNIATNAFLDSSAQWIYKQSFAASRYAQGSDGSHSWHTAASGTAGNAITFTQAMTLDASGNLVVGAASGNFNVNNQAISVSSAQSGTTSAAIDVRGYATSDATIGQITFFNASNLLALVSCARRGANNSGTLEFYTTNAGTLAERARIDASGYLLVNGTQQYTRVTIKGSAGVSNGYGILGATASTGCYFGAISATANDDFEIWNERDGYLRFATNNTERARIKAGGQFRFVPLAAAPAGAENGDVYYDSTTNKLRVYAGGAWTDLH